jgi:hypothetical protein
LRCARIGSVLSRSIGARNCTYAPISTAGSSDLSQVEHRCAALSGSARIAHSHTTPTRHPAARSSSRFRASRAAFLPSLSCQKSALFAGLVVKRHPACLCQKHPWTKTAARYFGKTISGLPGMSRTCSLNRKPIACSRFRKAFSGRVFAPRMPAIIRERVSLSTTSINSRLPLAWCVVASYKQKRS